MSTKLMFMLLGVCFLFIFSVTANDFERQKAGKPPKDQDPYKIFKSFNRFTKLTKTKGTTSDPCIQLVKNFLPLVAPAYLSCKTEMPPKRWIDAQLSLPPCFGRCLGEKMKVVAYTIDILLGQLDTDGAVDVINGQQLIEGKIPEQFKKYAAIVFEKCQAQILGIKGNDPNCESHRAATKCIVNQVAGFAMEALSQCPEVPEGFKRWIDNEIISKILKGPLTEGF